MKRTPLKRGTPLRRRTRLAPVNRRRRAAAHARNFGERANLVRAMPCLLSGAGCKGQVEAAHVRSRGAGGDRRDLVPLCSGHHREQHQRGLPTFCTTHKLDLRAAAARIAVELDERGVP